MEIHVDPLLISTEETACVLYFSLDTQRSNVQSLVSKLTVQFTQNGLHDLLLVCQSVRIAQKIISHEDVIHPTAQKIRKYQESVLALKRMSNFKTRLKLKLTQNRNVKKRFVFLVVLIT